MEILLLILLVSYLFIMPAIAMGKAVSVQGQLENLRREISDIRAQRRPVQRDVGLEKTPAATPSAERAPDSLQPPPLPPRPTATASEARPAPAPLVVKQHDAAPQPSFQWEQFFGAKFLGWVAGLLLFIGMVLLVKESIVRGWITREMRVAMGLITGVSLCITALRMQGRERFIIMAQNLAAAGVLMLYGVTFAAHALPPAIFSVVPTFLLLCGITVGAFLLSVRMNAQVVAVLGLLGGFLTPVLCSTGQDNALGLFTYIALLDVGLLLVATRQQWLHLAPLAAAATALTQLVWLKKFWLTSGYALGAATWVPWAILLLFASLFLGMAWRWRTMQSQMLVAAAAILCATAWIVCFSYGLQQSVAVRPVVLYSLVLGISALSLLLPWLRSELSALVLAIPIAAMLHLAAWTVGYLSHETLYAALCLYLLSGLLFTAHALYWLKLRPEHGLPTSLLMLAPMALMLLTVCLRADLPVSIWGFFMLANAVLVALAQRRSSLGSVLAGMILTLLGNAIWLMKLPPAAGQALPYLCLLGILAMLFIAASVWLAQSRPNEELTLSLPVAAAVLPFSLLWLSSQVLPTCSAAPFFTLAMVLCVAMLVMGAVFRFGPLAATSACCILLLELALYSQHGCASTTLVWYATFALLHLAYPWLTAQRLQHSTAPWAAAAISLLGTCALTYLWAEQELPAEWHAAVPACFGLIGLAMTVPLYRRASLHNAVHVAQLSWAGAATLMLLTLVFPIALDRQHLTVALALEGAALIALFQYLPHRGLRAWGLALLGIAFARLGMNPALLTDYPRAEGLLWNWHLMTYLPTILAMLYSARWLSRDDHAHPSETAMAPLLYAAAAVLGFVMVNLEIADAFTPAYEKAVRLFDFRHHVPRGMTRTLCWGAYALMLVSIGFWKRQRLARISGILLMIMTQIKVLVLDLAGLDSLYRIAAFIGMALMALAASYLYQRFAERSTD